MLELRLNQASGCLAAPLRDDLERLNMAQQQRSEEIRLRTGQRMTVTVQGKETTIGSHALEPKELEDTLSRATDYSVHTFADSLSRGFVTIQGGHRIGVCGQTAVRGGRVLSFRSLSSLNIRIARQILGAAQQQLVNKLYQDGTVSSALFLSPPGMGKTTLLRDLARQLSDSGVRTALADERSELAALYHGRPQFDIGRHTDVIDGCPKAEAAMMLVKTMSPQLLILDEITSEEDIQAVLCAAHCGVAVMASAHAWNVEDFQLRPLYRRIQEAQIFSKIFGIQHDHQVRLIK